MVYAVVDTNVLVSALWTKNPLAPTRRVLDMLVAKEFVPLYNAEVITEYRDVLNRPKFPFGVQEVEDLIGYIMEIGEDTARTKYDELMPDEDDRVFYEISLTVEDSFMVTGNLKHYPNVSKVVTPAEFLKHLITGPNPEFEKANQPMAEDEAKLAALRAAIDEGDASPDVKNFDRDAFLNELMAR